MTTETTNPEKKESQSTTANPVNSNTKEKEVVALKVADKGILLFGNRPVEAKHLQIVGTYKSVGSARPIVKSNLQVESTMTISGNRPITVSHLKISETFKVMSNRPVASNAIDDPLLLMGYLD